MLDLTPILSPLIIDNTMRYKLGWIILIVYGLLFIFNLGVIVIPFLNDCKNKAKTKIQANPKYVLAKTKVI